MKKFAFISDLFFTFLVAFLFALLFFRYLKVPLFVSVLLALLCGFLTTFSIGAYLYSRRKNLFLKKSEALQKEKLLLHLALAGDERNAEFFLNLLANQTTPPTAVKRTGKARLTSPHEVYFIRFTFAPVSADEIASYARLKTHRKKILLCSRVDETAKDLCARFDIQIRNGDEVFETVKKANAFPKDFLGDKPQEERKKRPFKLWFSKTNSRRFLTSGTLVLLLSRLTPFSYYYLTLGTLLLLAAVFTRIFGKE